MYLMYSRSKNPRPTPKTPEKQIKPTEFKNDPPKNINLAEIIDKELKSENSDYDAKRYNNFTLKKPEIIISKKGVFMKWLKLNWVASMESLCQMFKHFN